MKKLTFIVVFLIALSGCATVGDVKTEKDETVFYPPLPQRPRLQYLMSISSEDDLGGKKKVGFNDFLLGKDVYSKSIGKPYDISSERGKIYILDRAVRKVIYIDLTNREIDYIRDKRLGSLDNPAGIFIAEDEIKYVADTGRKQIVAYDKANEFLRTYGNKDIFEKPLDVVVYEDSIYVCDMEKNEVIVLDKATGELVKTIGKPGKKEGEFYKPTHVNVDHKGFLYVNDAFNFRAQKFDPDGNFIKSFGKLGDNTGCFARPKGIDIDREGHLYVADAAFENVQIFDDKTGRLLLFLGGPGNAKGSMYLPSSVHVDYENVDYFSTYVDPEFKLKYLLYVGNSFGRHKLNVYGYGDWIGPPLSVESGKKEDKANEKDEEIKEDKVIENKEDK